MKTNELQLRLYYLKQRAGNLKGWLTPFLILFILLSSFIRIEAQTTDLIPTLSYGNFTTVTLRNLDYSGAVNLATATSSFNPTMTVGNYSNEDDAWIHGTNITQPVVVEMSGNLEARDADDLTNTYHSTSMSFSADANKEVLKHLVFRVKNTVGAGILRESFRVKTTLRYINVVNNPNSFPSTGLIYINVNYDDLTVIAPPPTNLSYSPNPVVANINTTNVSSTPTVTGTIDSYSISPALPTGVTLNTTTGVISGTPTVVSPLTNYTVTATNSGGNTTAPFTLTVHGIPTIIPGHNSLTTFTTTQGIPSVSQYFTVSGTDLTNDVVVTPPAGFEVSTDNVTFSSSLTLPQSGGGVTGQPVSVYIRLSSTATAGSHGFMVNLTSTGASSNSVEVSGNVTARPAAELYTNIMSLASLTTIQGTPSEARKFTTTGKYLVNDATATAPTDCEISPDSINYSPTLTLLHAPNGTLVGEPVKIYVRIKATAALGSKFGGVVISTVGSSNSAMAEINTTVTPPPTPPTNLSYSPTPIVVVVGGPSITSTPTVTGTPTIYTISPTLPGTITIDPTTGVISGIPTVTSPFTTYTVTATNGGGSTTTTFKLTINPKAPSSLSYSPNPVVATVNLTSISSSPTVTGTVDSYSISPALPAGLTFNTTTGVISGVPTVISVLKVYTITATNVTGNTTATFTLTVNPVAPKNLSYSPTPVVTTVNTTSISSSPTVTGTVDSYSISPALPAGLTFNPTTGVISGIPTVVSVLTVYTITATNGGGSTTATFTLTVKNVAPSNLSYSPNPVVAIVKTTSVSSVPTITGIVDTYSISPALPAGVLLNPTTGVISGIPTVETALINYTVTATNSIGSTTAIFTLTVDKIPTLTTSAGNGNIVVGSNGVVIDPGVTITSLAPTTTVNNGIVYISTGFISSEDKIIYPTNLYGVTGVYNSSTGVLLLSGTATVAQYQEIFRTIKYQDTNPLAVAASRAFTFSLGNAIPFNGHYYEYVSNPNIEWSDAKTAADNKSYFGLQGYLVTITSAAENDFVFNRIKLTGWIGANDANSEGVWKWITGPEAGQQFWQGAANGNTVGSMYSNWQPNQPDNTFGAENWALYMADGKWNDYPHVSQILSSWPQVLGYYVEYGGMAGDPIVALSGVKALSLKILPAPTVTNPNQAFCGNGTVSNLVATAPAGSSVRWWDAATGGNLLASTTALVTTKTYYAETWDGTSASLSRTAVLVTINIVPAQPVIVPTSTAKNKIKLCPGDNIVCSNFDNTLSYQWKFNGNNISGQTSNQYKVPVGGAGIYSLYVKNPTTGCDISSSSVTVDLYSVTTPVIYEKKKSDYISILIVDNRSNLYSSYLWSYSDGTALPSTIVNDRQFLVLPPTNMAATYMVNITDTNACKVTSAVKTVVLHTIAAKAYPTLNNGNFMVSLTDAQDGKLNVKIFNQNGILQKVYSFDNVSSEFEYQINAAGLKTGSYTVEISLGDYVQTQKMIIQ